MSSLKSKLNDPMFWIDTEALMFPLRTFIWNLILMTFFRPSKEVQYYIGLFRMTKRSHELRGMYWDSAAVLARQEVHQHIVLESVRRLSESWGADVREMPAKI